MGLGVADYNRPEREDPLRKRQTGLPARHIGVRL